MGRFEALKVTIDANIRENGNQEITGEVLNRVLNEMVSVTEEEVAEAAASGGGGGEGGGGGITEEKEVYIGTEPTEEAKLWIDPTGTPSGGNGGGSSESGESASPYAAKVFIVPDGVMTATEAAPYVFTPAETEEFLAQGDFKRTIVKYPTQVLGMGALNIANLCLYIESDSAQGFICEGTEVTKVSGEMDSAIEYIKTTITCANTPNAIMGYCSISKYYATPK